MIFLGGIDNLELEDLTALTRLLKWRATLSLSSRAITESRKQTMREIDRVPKLKITISGQQFLDRIKEIALGLDGYKISNEKAVPGDGSMIELTRPEKGKEAIIIRLISLESSGSSIDIRLMNAWSGTPFSEYLAQVKGALSPLLKAYRRRFTGRVRINVPDQPLATRRPTGARRILDAFGRVTNKYNPNSADWSYFYEFVIYCHDQRVRLDGAELRELLLDAEFPASVVDDLVDAYDHGRKILSLQPKARSGRAWARVIAKKGSCDV